MELKIDKEYEIVCKVEDDYLKDGKTEEKCPYCNTELRKLGTNVSYTIIFKTDNYWFVTCNGNSQVPSEMVSKS